MAKNAAAAGKRGSLGVRATHAYRHRQAKVINCLLQHTPHYLKSCFEQWCLRFRVCVCVSAFMCKFVAVCVWNSARGRKQQRFLIVTPHALLPHTTAPLDKTATDNKQANLHFHQPSPQARPISRVSFPHHKVQTPIGHIKVFLPLPCY